MTFWLVDEIASWLANILPIDIGGTTEGGEGGARPGGKTDVPDVRGLGVDDARRALSREGFKVEIVRLEERPAPVMGMVLQQDPAPGTRRRRGRSVTISVHHPPADQAR
jgi:hypothetical protein